MKNTTRIITFIGSAIIVASSSFGNAQAPAPAPAASASASQILTQPADPAATTWKSEKNWAGDLRLRIHDSKDGTNDTRIYEQIRARLAYRADIEPNLSATLRLATGTSAISANQTLGDGGTPGMQRRAFGLDQAYFDYRPCLDTKVWLGKTPNPYYAPAGNQLIFDADIDFEGLSAKWNSDGTDFGLFAALGGSLISENYAAGVDTPDSGLLGAQVGATWKQIGLTGAVAAYTYFGVEGRPATNVAPTTSLIVTPGRFGGNSLNGTTFASGFQIYEAALSWKHTWDALQVELFYDMLQNAVGRLGHSAYETGVVAKYGPWSAGYALVFKEADSTVGAFSDSDTNGGGTDTNGARANISYQISKVITASLTDFRAKRNISTAAPSDFGDTILDFAASF